MKLRDRSRLVTLMTEEGVSVRGLAAAVGVSHSMIQQLRDGTRTSCTPGLAALIAEELGVMPRFLFDVHTSNPTVRIIERRERQEVTA
jgi:transcriptional regulator with XRE-family HTH domain